MVWKDASVRREDGGSPHATRAPRVGVITQAYRVALARHAREQGTLVITQLVLAENSNVEALCELQRLLNMASAFSPGEACLLGRGQELQLPST